MGRTIRICSALALALVPALAAARPIEPSALGHYVRARLASNGDETARAVESYAAALAADPDSLTVAVRAYRTALEAGDYDLALRSVRTMAREEATPPDALLFQYVAALRDRDWKRAQAELERVGKQSGLSFLAPLFASWLELGTQTPVRIESGKAIDQRPNAYAAENAALVALAKGDATDAVLAIKAMWAADPYRAGSLRMAAASRLADRKMKDRALALVIADDMAAQNARARIAAGKSLGVSVASPIDGAAFVLARMAGDLIVERSSRSALAVARIAAYAAPKNARIQLTLAGALAARGRNREALAIAERVVPDPVYGDDAASLRIEQLEVTGRVEEALAAARSRADRSPNDAARIGDIEIRRGNYGAAFAAYRKTIAQSPDGAGASLILSAASAADASGDWAGAKPLLERALTLRPDDPAILNELGYGLVTHGEDMARGAQLISRAAELQPDNAAIIDSLGWAHYRKGALADAIPLLERAMKLDQGQPEIAEHLGDAYWQAGRRIDARYAWAAAREVAEGDAKARLSAKIADGPVTR